MKNAIEDAGLEKCQVDGLISRGPDDVYCHHQRMGELLGMDVSFSTTLDSGGASQCLGVATRVHGDRGRTLHDGRVRLRPRLLDAHTLA